MLNAAASGRPGRSRSCHAVLAERKQLTQPLRALVAGLKDVDALVQRCAAEALGTHPAPRICGPCWTADTPFRRTILTCGTWSAWPCTSSAPGGLDGTDRPERTRCPGPGRCGPRSPRRRPPGSCWPFAPPAGIVRQPGDLATRARGYGTDAGLDTLIRSPGQSPGTSSAWLCSRPSSKASRPRARPTASLQTWAEELSRSCLPPVTRQRSSAVSSWPAP